MAIPSCDGCKKWDLYYDFEKIATTVAHPNPDSRHLTTGWTLVDMYGKVAIDETSNRLMYLNGNNTFSRYRMSEVSTRVPEGNCAPGADPNYCFRFESSITKKSGSEYEYAVAWKTSKNIVSPGSAMKAAPYSASSRTSEDEFQRLVARAQKIVDQQLG
ncbi:hypothetical protein ACOQFL_14770 [Actinopolyspora sp. H202]|uniref:hypothetical protein n=1 Tax=Actinopolyspora sp. H202 TaxID=1500456 RepID=UPI003EE81825